MKQFLKFLRHHKKESILAPLFKMLEAFFDLLVPLIMADVINNGIGSGDSAYIMQRCLLMVALGIIGLACSITAQYFAAKAAVESCASVRHALFDKIQSLGFAETDTTGTSTLITRMTSDVNQLQNGLNLFLRLFLRSPFVVLGAMVMAFMVNVEGAWIFVVALPVLSVVVFGIMLKTMPLYARVQVRLDKLTGLTRQNLTGVRVVRAFGREEDEVRDFKAADKELTGSQLLVGRISNLMNPLTFVILNLALVALLQTGALEINTGTMALGDVVALVNYLNQILLELVKLANLIIQMTKAAACAKRINTVLALEPRMQFGTLQPDDVLGMKGQKNGGKEDAGLVAVVGTDNEKLLSSSALQPAVEFSHVGLSYAGAGAESLSDITFTAFKGQTIGVIGGTGSGKTSLVSLIPRYYDATSGSVKLFGRDIRTYDKSGLRRAISTVMQKAQLFTGTIRSNLQWGNAQAGDEELWQALTLAQAAEVVRGKKLGLDEPVEQGGRNFSGGQKQRLSIARSLAAHPRILILDDSSSALDYATDAALRQALRTLPEDMTVFIVSQRANSLAHADQILVLDEGRLVGLGKHEDLLKTCPVYQDIYRSQFQKNEAV
jgi:ATP-binding cassette subfamily B multidrug efflux pump